MMFWRILQFFWCFFESLTMDKFGSCPTVVKSAAKKHSGSYHCSSPAGQSQLVILHVHQGEGHPRITLLVEG
jgi:hypothetical protein